MCPRVCCDAPTLSPLQSPALLYVRTRCESLAAHPGQSRASIDATHQHLSAAALLPAVIQITVHRRIHHLKGEARYLGENKHRRVIAGRSRRELELVSCATRVFFDVDRDLQQLTDRP